MTDGEVAAALRMHPATTARSLARHVGMSQAETEAALRRLVSAGRAQVVGTTTGLDVVAGQTVYDPYPAWPRDVKA